MTNPDDLLLEVAVVAKRLKCCQETIRRYIRKGRLHAIRVGSGTTGHWRIPESALKVLTRPVATRRAPVDRCGIYFVEGAGLVKIGMGVNVLSRFGAMAGASPVPLDMIGWIPVTQSDLAAREQAIHQEFAADHVRGEWFRIDRERLAAYISAHRGIIGKPALKIQQAEQVATPAQQSATPPRQSAS